ncbi:MAG: Mur ligase domain-containing protein, partial [Actinomycetota bacterium]|nr:Mur ligase domain-containing protein [Actinomycetota bacterium]
MKPRPLASVAAAVEGELTGDDLDISSVTTDSRQAGPGSLFVALEGERTDGHRFVLDAVARGAVAVLVREGADAPTPKIQVASTADALLRLAADERRRFDGTVVAIAGANGKTSTKDMTGAVVSTRFRVHASPGSFNNEVGVPLTFLGAPPDTEVIVAELGARRA